MAVDIEPVVLPAKHKPVNFSQRTLLMRCLGGLLLGLAALLCFWLFVLPVLVVALSSVAAHWSGTILPEGYSLRWFERLGSSDFDALVTSMEVGFGVAVGGTFLGVWLALALEGRDRRGLGALVDTIAARCTESSSGARNVENILSRTLLPELSAEVLARMADGAPITEVTVGMDPSGAFRYALD